MSRPCSSCDKPWEEQTVEEKVESLATYCQLMDEWITEVEEWAVANNKGSGIFEPGSPERPKHPKDWRCPPQFHKK